MNVKISVITVTYNSAATLQQTIDSVASQEYSNVEYLIVDGCSTDETMNIVEMNRNVIASVVSEPDEGLYDAMNKGIGLATGDIIAILNSDDCYSHPQVLTLVAQAFESHKCELVYGNLDFYDEEMEYVVRSWVPGSYSATTFRRGWHPPHPSLFVSNQCYRQVGLYDTKFRMCADFDFMLRAFEKHDSTWCYIPQTLVHMRTGGQTTGSWWNFIDGNLQVLESFKKNGIKVGSLTYLWRRLAPKVVSMVKAKINRSTS